MSFIWLLFTIKWKIPWELHKIAFRGKWQVNRVTYLGCNYTPMNKIVGAGGHSFCWSWNRINKERAILICCDRENLCECCWGIIEGVIEYFLNQAIDKDSDNGLEGMHEPNKVWAILWWICIVNHISLMLHSKFDCTNHIEHIFPMTNFTPALLAA